MPQTTSFGTDRHALRPCTFVALALLAAACSGVAAGVDDAEGVSLSIANGSISIAVGESTQLNALPVDTRGKAIGGLYTIAWTSAQPAIARVDAAGTLVGVAAGTTTINAVATVVKTGVTASASAMVTVAGAPSAPGCGDHTCDASESCSTCPADCGACTPPPPTATTTSIFPSSSAPANALGNDGQPIELGVKFRTTTAGTITKLRFYKGAGTSGTHVGTLWSGAGAQLATVTFTGESASGWQEATLAAPVAVSAGTTYVASVHSSSGDYPSTVSFFTSAVVNGPLRALADGEDGPNGVYKYAASSAFPTDSYLASDYFVDVVLATAGTTPTPTPTAYQAELIVIQGESNAGGIALDSSALPSELAPRSSVQILNNDSLVFESLHIGVNNDLDQYVPDPTTEHGMELGLANEVDAGRFKVPVYLVKCGASGSYVSQWLPNSTRGLFEEYTPLVDKAVALLKAKGITPRITFWQSLGLNDRYQQGTTAAGFRTMMDQLKTAFRARYGANIAFLSTNFNNPPAQTYDFVTVFNDMAAADPLQRSISVIGATYVDGSVHYDYAGFKLIAHNMASAHALLP